MPEKPIFMADGLVKCIRASFSDGLLTDGSVYTVAHNAALTGGLELKEVPYPNTRGIRYWDYERFEPYHGMDSTEYDDTLASQAIYSDLERGND